MAQCSNGTMSALRGDAVSPGEIETIPKKDAPVLNRRVLSQINDIAGG